MPRASSRELVGKVADALELENPKSIGEIASEVDSDRQAVTAYLEALTNHPYVEEVETSDSRYRKFQVFRRSTNPDPVKDIPAWRYFERQEENRLQFLRERAEVSDQP